MPIEFQLKKFLELPKVFEKVMENTLQLQQSDKINHYTKGTTWKEKMKAFIPGQIVLPFHFYGDGAQLNNPLGPHTSEIQFNYFTLPMVPNQFQSRLENIFVAQIYPGDYKSAFIFSNL